MKRIERMVMKRCLVGLLAGAALGSVGLFTPDSSAVGTRRVALRSSQDFSAGELNGVAIDSTGKVRAGFNLGNIPVPDATAVWSVLRTRTGSVLMATGNEGKLLELSGGAVKQVAKAEALSLTSVIEAWGGTVLVSALPGGKLYEYQNGKLTEWLTLKDAEHVFQLAFDPREQVVYAATGPNGKLFRITRDKKAQVYFDAEEEHLVSVAVGTGQIYAGGGDSAKLYQLSAPGRASVLYDFGRTEVRAIVVGKKGEVYAIANELKEKRALPTKSGEEAAQPSAASAAKASKGKGTLYRFETNGTPEQLLDDSNEHYVSLALDADGNPYVGTGAEGKLYTVDANRNSVLVADVEERQVTALLMDGKDRVVFGSDPLTVRPVRGTGGPDSTWTSPVIDANLRARFGRLSWVADGQLELATRSGNSEKPDDTWSPWSTDMALPNDIQSPPGRFVQVRARFARDPNAVLREVVVPFVTDNLRAIITSIDFEDTATASLSSLRDKLASSGGPITGNPKKEIEIKWQVDNPDKDELRFRLDYRQEGSNSWYPILDPKEKLTKASYSWNTADLPEGRYRVRVVASDELANPPELVLRHTLESHVVLVDSTPPTLTGLAIQGRRLRGTARDGVGPITRIEVGVAGSGEWIPVAPSDGVFDENEEAFSFDLSALVPSGGALVTVRAYDAQKNQVVESIVLR